MVRWGCMCLVGRSRLSRVERSPACKSVAPCLQAPRQAPGEGTARSDFSNGLAHPRREKSQVHTHIYMYMYIYIHTHIHTYIYMHAPAPRAPRRGRRCRRTGEACGRSPRCSPGRAACPPPAASWAGTRAARTPRCTVWVFWRVVST